MADLGLTPIELVQRVEAPPEVVFAYFIDPARMAQWIGGVPHLDPRQGGGYRVEMAEGPVASGEIRELDPPRRIVLTWGWEGSPSLPPGSTTVEITLIPEDDGTLVRLRHLGLPDEAARQEHQRGWTARVRRLALLR